MKRALPLILALTLVLPGASIIPGAAAQSPPVSSTAGPAKAYPTYPVLTAELRGMATEHKDILRLHSAGQSSAGFDLWWVEVANFEDEDRKPLDEREVLYIDGGTHANEYIGVIFTMHALRELVEGYGENDTATWIVENRHTVVLPLVNPEGSMNGVGRLNDKGVNINRNFPVGWYDVDETPVVNNPGPYPASEPETRAVMGVWEEVDPDYVLSIHCCGNLWLYPYGIEGRHAHPDDRQVYESICDEVLHDVREDCGETWSTIYPASGITSDSGYELTGANSWSFEMSGRNSKGFPWGPPAYTEQIEEMERESWRALQHAFLNVHLYGANLQAVDVHGEDEGLVLDLENVGWGNLTDATVTVVDDRGEERTVTVPGVAAGNATSVLLPEPLSEGEHQVTISYKKRPLDDKRGLHRYVLTLPTEGEASLENGTVEDGVDLQATGGASAAGATGAEVPVPPALSLVALVAAGLVLRHRRGRT